MTTNLASCASMCGLKPRNGVELLQNGRIPSLPKGKKTRCVWVVTGIIKIKCHPFWGTRGLPSNAKGMIHEFCCVFFLLVNVDCYFWVGCTMTTVRVGKKTNMDT